MIKLDDLEVYLRNLLGEDRMDKDPLLPDGLQVSGKKEIYKICFGVSASLELFNKVKDSKGDSLVVHHGMILPKRYIDSVYYKRLEFLIENKISVFGFHYLLDSHPKVGNNSVILRKLGATLNGAYADEWGYSGKLNEAKDRSDIVEQCTEMFGTSGVQYLFGEEKIDEIVSVSGGYAPSLNELIEMKSNGVDLFIGGETREWVRENVRESQMNYLAMGHYNTETIGIKALMENVETYFEGNVQCEFIDFHNQI